jgi:precorrin-2/cobalt-factor-2 C20-methyltransferase
VSGTLYGLGVGPGDPELITLKAYRLLQAAPVIAYPAPDEGESLARRIAAPHIPAGRTEIAIRVPMRPERDPAQEVYGRAAGELAEHLSAGRDVAVLCEGDPFFYGSFMYLFGRLAGRFPARVVPGVTSLTACAAALGAPLAARDDQLVVLPASLEARTLTFRLSEADAAAVIKLGRHFPKVRDCLAATGLMPKSRYIERASLETQRILPLAEVDPASVPYFSMILLHRRGEAWTV